MSDKEFDSIYPLEIIEKSTRHFSGIQVIKETIKFFNDNGGSNVLDLGSGVGKFCFMGSVFDKNNMCFTGVEYRSKFVKLCNKLKVNYAFNNINFIHEDILNIDLNNFDSIYFFNSFFEHKVKYLRIDNDIELDIRKFFSYTNMLKLKLENTPPGTKLVTYYSTNFQIPNSFKLKYVAFEDNLKCWIKQ